MDKREDRVLGHNLTDAQNMTTEVRIVQSLALWFKKTVRIEWQAALSTEVPC